MDRPAKRDQNGDPIGADPTPRTARAVVWPRTSTEDAEGGIKVVAGYNVKLAAGDPITAISRMYVRDEWWEVDGRPGVYLGKAVLVVLRTEGP